MHHVDGVSRGNHLVDHGIRDIRTGAGHLERDGDIALDRLAVGVEFKPPDPEAVDQVECLAVQDAVGRTERQQGGGAWGRDHAA